MLQTDFDSEPDSDAGVDILTGLHPKPCEERGTIKFYFKGLE